MTAYLRVDQLHAKLARQMREAELQRLVIDAARQLGWLVYHTHDSRHSASGYPDLSMVRVGKREARHVYVELKREGKAPTPEQQIWLDSMAIVPGHEVYVWHPSDWLSERIMAVLS